MTDSKTPLQRPSLSFRGIDHLKLPSSSITKTHDFYTKIFPFTPMPQYDHFTPDHKLFAKMFYYEPHKLIVEVRYVPEQAAAQKGWDPITWGVGKRQDLEEWTKWFDANGVKHSTSSSSLTFLYVCLLWWLRTFPSVR